MQDGWRVNERLTLREPPDWRIELNAGAVELGKTNGAQSSEVVFPGSRVVRTRRGCSQEKLQQKRNDAGGQKFHVVESRVKITEPESEYRSLQPGK